MKNIPQSTYYTNDDIDHLSICYENLYCINGEMTYLTTIIENLPNVYKCVNFYTWKPKIKLFNTNEELIQYINNLQNLEHIELSAYCDMIWAHNIGHGIFDGLYPIYLALIKFGFINNNFTIITNIDKSIMMYNIVNIFSGSELIEENTLKNRTIHFNKLICGTGGTGNCVVNQDYELYGSKYNGIKYFRERMLNRYNINTNISINNKLNIIIIDNKRYSEYEKNILKNIISIFSNSTNIKYIYWNTYKSFKDQLNEILNSDIQITGPGTGMLYIPFLKPNSVNINLGYIEHTSNKSRGNINIKETDTDFIIPGWMEQSICNGCSHVNTIYYDRLTYNNLELNPMIDIINKAISIINGELNIESNLNIDALIFKEYCKKVNNVKEICNNMILNSYYADVSLFINEHPYVAPKEIVDIELLRKIKDDFSYNRKYEIKL